MNYQFFTGISEIRSQLKKAEDDYMQAITIGTNPDELNKIKHRMSVLQVQLNRTLKGFGR